MWLWRIMGKKKPSRKRLRGELTRGTEELQSPVSAVYTPFSSWLGASAEVMQPYPTTVS